MTNSNLIKTLFHVKHATVKSYDIDESRKEIIIELRLHTSHSRRCPICGKKVPGYDSRPGYRRWRTLDCGGYKVYLIAPTERIECPEHGVHMAAVPWADHGSRFTRIFEAEVAFLAMHGTKSMVARKMRIDWDTVGAILARVHCVLEPDISVRWQNLKQIGIDETSYRKGHKYITTVTDHDTNQVVWVGVGTGKGVLSQFFECLTPEQRAAIEVVTCDGARWIKSCIEEWLPNAVRCVDPFHVVQWALEAMDEVRKGEWRKAKKEDQSLPKRKRGRPKKGEEQQKKAPEIKGAKYALGKNPENLTARQQAQLEDFQKNQSPLFRAWQMKELLRNYFHTCLTKEELSLQLDGWCAWAARCRIPAMVELGKKIKRNKDAILCTVELGVSNARVEAMNNKIKVMIRMAYGFRNMENLKSAVLMGCSRLAKELEPIHVLLQPQKQMKLGEWLQ